MRYAGILVVCWVDALVPIVPIGINFQLQKPVFEIRCTEAMKFMYRNKPQNTFNLA